MNCERFSDGLCLIASEMAGRDAIATNGACDKCQSSEVPMARNEVTAGLAIWAWRDDKAKQIELRESLKDAIGVSEARRSVLRGNGPGSQLHRMLESIGIVPGDACACWNRAKQMNDWGVIGCQSRIAEITGWMVEDANKRKFADRLGELAGGFLATVATEVLPVEYLARCVVSLAIRKAMGKGGQ